LANYELLDADFADPFHRDPRGSLRDHTKLLSLAWVEEL